MKWGIAVMSSRTSFINPGILRHDFKRFGWIGAVYLLGLLLAVPLKIAMIYSRQVATGAVYQIGSNPYLQVFSFESPLQLLLWLSVPVLTGVLLFRYLQSGEAADLAHTLPVRRETLYNTHLTAGVILLFVPVIATSLVSSAVLQGLGVDYVSGHEVLIWLGVALIFNLLLFTCSAAVGMISGMSTVQAALTYILLLLPAGFTALLFDNMSMYVLGFPHDFLGNNLEKLSPLLRITLNRPFSTAEIVIYLLCCAAFYLLGRYLYRRRPSENAGNALAFRGLHPVLIYGITFCGMLLLGSYFHATQNTMGWTYFGYFLGSILGYVLSIVLINKSLDIFRFRVLRNYLLYSLVVVLLIGGLNYDLIGYEKRIPALADVKAVYMDSSFYRLMQTQTGRPYYYYGGEMANEVYQREVSMVYTSAENIANIHEFHQAIINNRNIEKPLLREYDRSVSSRIWCLAYYLENGKTVYRQYRVPVERYDARIKPVYESQEHKKMVCDILNISPRQVDLWSLTHEVNRSVKITDPALILQAVNALQMDARSQTYEEMTSDNPPWAEVNLLLNDGKRLSLSWRKSYVFFENWLKDVGEYANARVMPADIKYALVEKMPLPDNDPRAEAMEKYRTIDSDAYLRELETSGKCLRITDPAQIEDLLQRCTHKADNYRVCFVMHNGTYFSAGLPK